MRAGFAFGSFGEEVLEFLRLEQMEVHRERELKEERHSNREQVSQMPHGELGQGFNQQKWRIIINDNR